mmetsp:Transcript_19328/g.54545  ORF Transcript_19328/g.54545 Transcript_19328/m.54545 type:complete len:289 (+) Transcript_19328:43-909(+)
MLGMSLQVARKMVQRPLPLLLKLGTQRASSRIPKELRADRGILVQLMHSDPLLLSIERHRHQRLAHNRQEAGKPEVHGKRVQVRGVARAAEVRQVQMLRYRVEADEGCVLDMLDTEGVELATLRSGHIAQAIQHVLRFRDSLWIRMADERDEVNHDKPDHPAGVSRQLHQEAAPGRDAPEAKRGGLRHAMHDAQLHERRALKVRQADHSCGEDIEEQDERKVPGQPRAQGVQWSSMRTFRNLLLPIDDYGCNADSEGPHGSEDIRELAALAGLNHARAPALQARSAPV